MADLAGYRLVTTDDATVVQAWGGVWGQVPGIPESIQLPNGDVTYAPSVGQMLGPKGEWQLIEWLVDEPKPSTDPNDYPLLPRQFRAIINIAGLQAKALAAIASIPDNRQQAIAASFFEYSLSFERSHPLIIQLSTAAGVTSDQLDALWMQAKDI